MEDIKKMTPAGVIFLLDYFKDGINHQVVLFWIHEAESNVLVRESADIVTFSDYNATLVAMCSNIGSGNIISKQLSQHEVCV